MRAHNFSIDFLSRPKFNLPLFDVFFIGDHNVTKQKETRHFHMLRTEIIEHLYFPVTLIVFAGNVQSVFTILIFVELRHR